MVPLSELFNGRGYEVLDWWVGWVSQREPDPLSRARPPSIRDARAAKERLGATE